MEKIFFFRKNCHVNNLILYLYKKRNENADRSNSFMFEVTEPIIWVAESIMYVESTRCIYR